MLYKLELYLKDAEHLLLLLGYCLICYTWKGTQDIQVSPYQPISYRFTVYLPPLQCLVVIILVIEVKEL